MRYLIRGVPERLEMLEYLRARLPQAEFVIDQQRSAWLNFLAALRLAGQDAVLHMEDDILLTRDFSEKIEAAIAERPGDVIQFFSMRSKDLTEGSRYDRRFMMAQCFYLPAGASAALLHYAPIYKRPAGAIAGYDLLVADWLKARRTAYWLHVPSLVEHRVAVSLIDSRRSSKRQSKTFCDPWE